MGLDDDNDCAHEWALIGVVLKAGASLTVNECVECGTQSWVPAGHSRA